MNVEVIQSTTKRIKAVTIGLGSVNPKYYLGYRGELRHAESDATKMQHLFVSNGIDTTTLLTQYATKDNIKEVFLEGVIDMVANDLFIMTISGHGNKVRDWNRDEIDEIGWWSGWNWYDEVIYTYDGEILDDDISEWLTFVPEGVRVLLIYDTCYSGGMGLDTTNEFKGQLIVISGCDEDEVAYAVFGGGNLFNALLSNGISWDLSTVSPFNWFVKATKGMLDTTQTPQFMEYNTTDDFKYGGI